MKYFISALVFFASLSFVSAQCDTKMVFTQDMTFDDIVSIKNRMDAQGHILNFKRIEFDKKGKLKALEFGIETNDGFMGSAKSNDIDKGGSITYIKYKTGSDVLIVKPGDQ